MEQGNMPGPFVRSRGTSAQWVKDSEWRAAACSSERCVPTLEALLCPSCHRHARSHSHALRRHYARASALRRHYTRARAPEDDPHNAVLCKRVKAVDWHRWRPEGKPLPVLAAGQPVSTVLSPGRTRLAVLTVRYGAPCPSRSLLFPRASSATPVRRPLRLATHLVCRVFAVVLSAW